MIEINWDPSPYLGPIMINWYGLTFLLGIVAAWILVRRWAPDYGITRDHVDNAIAWTAAGAMIGARLYFVAQNDPWQYLTAPWTIFAVWEGGLAFFGGLFGAIAAGALYCRKNGVSFLRLADLFAPAIPIGAAIGRTSCGLAGMDYGMPTSLPWGVMYTNRASYAPVDGISRHPTQFYELAGDLVIAAVLFRLRTRVPQGVLFLAYLVLFSVLRFLLFFVRGDVPPVALGLTNGHWTALAILTVGAPLYAMVIRHMTTREPHSI